MVRSGAAAVKSRMESEKLSVTAAPLESCRPLPLAETPS